MHFNLVFKTGLPDALDFHESSCFQKAVPEKTFNLPYFKECPGFFQKNLLEWKTSRFFLSNPSGISDIKVALDVRLLLLKTRQKSLTIKKSRNFLSSFIEFLSSDVFPL